MKVIKYLDEHLEELLMVFFLGVISILIMLQVIMRYFFHHALPWPEEACRYLFVYSSMLSVSYCMAKDKNFVVEFIYDMFPKYRRNKNIYQEIR
ncbi:MAG: TRAP transporter small permease subunit [Lachnospiraceae bacterium]|nr:TRAP transporter small permease subunit [Lachnospiraceae bacterium]